MSNSLNKRVIVRADKAGVFYGTLSAKNGSELTLTNARKLYYWSGAKSVEDLANQGVKNPHNCQFTEYVKEIELNCYIQFSPCTEEAIKSIENVPVWKA